MTRSKPQRSCHANPSRSCSLDVLDSIVVKCADNDNLDNKFLFCKIYTKALTCPKSAYQIIFDSSDLSTTQARHFS